MLGIEFPSCASSLPMVVDCCDLSMARTAESQSSKTYHLYRHQFIVCNEKKYVLDGSQICFQKNVSASTQNLETSQMSNEK
jgi:hypothetical protein